MFVIWYDTQWWPRTPFRFVIHVFLSFSDSFLFDVLLFAQINFVAG